MPSDAYATRPSPFVSSSKNLLESTWLNKLQTSKRFFGVAGTIYLAGSDAVELTSQFHISQQTNNYTNFGKSAARVTGHWTGMLVGSQLGAEYGALTGTFFGGPIGTAVGGIVGGIGGGIAGYTGGDRIAQKLYE